MRGYNFSFYGVFTELWLKDKYTDPYQSMNLFVIDCLYIFIFKVWAHYGTPG